MKFENGLDDTKPQTAADDAPLVLREAVILVPHGVEFLFGHALARIGHFDARAVALAVAAHDDAPVLSCIVDGVAYEVIHDAVRLFPVAAHYEIGLYLRFELIALCLFHDAEPLHRFGDARGEVERRDDKLHNARFEFAQLYDFVDKRGETLRFVYYDLRLLGGLLLVTSRNVAYHLGVSAYHCKRRFHVMRDVGEQIAAEAVVLLRLVERIVECGGQLVYFGELGLGGKRFALSPALFRNAVRKVAHGTRRRPRSEERHYRRHYKARHGYDGQLPREGVARARKRGQFAGHIDIQHIAYSHVAVVHTRSVAVDYKALLHVFEGSGIVDEGRITAINELGIEEYLLSVISSEMSATASLELLKSHAVISRSWLLAQIRKDKAQAGLKPVSTRHTADELIRWYDREEHRLFDVCADDHCQRYQGITRASTPLVGEAVRATRGEILTCDGTICDTRFSKCCGGVMERFSSCWEEVDPPYLVARRDSRDELDFPDLRIEENARRWIETTPEAYCHTTDARILAQVLNNYDRETTDFYRWRVDYTQEELASLIREKSGLDLGQIIDLRPVERGTSGRIVRLRIEGTRRAITIGKELEIRRTLSPSHLYSSAFVVDRQEMVDGIPRRFVLRGAGWGHGVGLCQIGAAVMGEQGYSYRQILLHYYAGATLEKIY